MFELLLSKIALLGGTIYAIVEFIKPVYDHEKHKWNVDAVIALAFGIAIAVLAKIDLFSYIGVIFDVPYAAYVLSGIIIGGSVGAGLIHDFPDWVKALFGRGA